MAEHGFELGYTPDQVGGRLWTKLVLQRAGLIRPAPKRSAHRKKRPRRPLPGMMLFQDGSRHPWLEGQPPLDLIATMDDATSELYSAFLVEEEGTFSSFRGLAEVVERHGLFSSLYTGRGSHYFFTPKAGGKVAKEQPTAVGRALQQLGIEHIASYSPEARGRMERLFGTLQQAHRYHFVKTTVRVHEYADASLAVFHGPRCLARYRPDGSHIGEDNRSAA